MQVELTINIHNLYSGKLRLQWYKNEPSGTTITYWKLANKRSKFERDWPVRHLSFWSAIFLFEKNYMWSYHVTFQVSATKQGGSISHLSFGNNHNMLNIGNIQVHTCDVSVGRIRCHFYMSRKTDGRCQKHQFCGQDIADGLRPISHSQSNFLRIFELSSVTHAL